MSSSQWSLTRLHIPNDKQVLELALVLLDCVEGGASVSFMHPLSMDRAVACWRRVAQDVVEAERALLAAGDADGLCGTVQLVLEHRRTSHIEPMCRRCWCTDGRAVRAWARR
jgi:hypothetical protein